MQFGVEFPFELASICKAIVGEREKLNLVASIGSIQILRLVLYKLNLLSNIHFSYGIVDEINSLRSS